MVDSTEAADVLPSCLTDPPLHRVGMIANSCRTVSHPTQIDDLARTSRDLPASGVWGLQVCVEVGATCVRCLEPAPRLPTPASLLTILPFAPMLQHSLHVVPHHPVAPVVFFRSRLSNFVLHKSDHHQSSAAGQWSRCSEFITQIHRIQTLECQLHCAPLKGGAAAHFLQFGSLDKTAVRGRWQSTRTARVYINEGVAALASIVTTPAQESHIRSLAEMVASAKIPSR